MLSHSARVFHKCIPIFCRVITRAGKQKTNVRRNDINVNLLQQIQQLEQQYVSPVLVSPADKIKES